MRRLYEISFRRGDGSFSLVRVRANTRATARKAAAGRLRRSEGLPDAAPLSVLSVRYVPPEER